jgi:hypothetical protein
MHIYLYVKQHQSTGLLYFGKTTKVDPFKYKGSGKHWGRHLKKHGREISTIEVWGFDNQDACTRFALEFSEKHCIVESKRWANLKPENGLDGGGAPGRVCSEETKAKMRAALLGRDLGKKHSEEAKAKMQKPKSEEHIAKMRARIYSEETKAKMRAAKLGKKHTDETKAKMRAAKLGKSIPYEKKSSRVETLVELHPITLRIP